VANIQSAIKRARQAEAHRLRNVGQRSSLRTFVKKTLLAVLAGDKPAATVAFKEAESKLDSYARRDLVHKNKAARLKSRLSAKLKAMIA
jgi:small subunit ribosomal protein S20